MAWTRTGDDAATYPKLMQTAGVEGADERTVNEVAGWISRMAWQSAGHMTDYVVDVGTAWMLGGARTAELIRIAKRTGLLTEITTEAGLPAYELIQDPEFIHIRLRKEVEWERQQGKDTRDPRLTVHVRRRDGDQCRWCQHVVLWRGRGTNRSGTIDHLNPGVPGTVETMVVACKRCNSSRQDNAQWQDDHPLLPPPTAPLYSKWTAEFLTDNGYPTEPNIGPEARQQPSDPDPARPTAVRPGPRSTAAPATPLSDAHTGPGAHKKSADKSPPRSRESHSSGSGRDGTGSGRSGKGQDGTGRVGSPAPPRTKPRRRRGRRGGKRT